MNTSKPIPKPSAPRPPDSIVEEKKRLIPAILGDVTPDHNSVSRIHYATLLTKLGSPQQAAAWAIYEMVEVDRLLRPILIGTGIPSVPGPYGELWEEVSPDALPTNPVAMDFELEATPALSEYWKGLSKPTVVRDSTASGSQLPVAKSGELNGQTDTTSDTRKKSRRRIGAAAGACAEHVRKMMQKDDTATLTAGVHDFIESCDGSFSSKPLKHSTLYRTLTDHPDLWKPNADSDKSRTTTTSEK